MQALAYLGTCLPTVVHTVYAFVRRVHERRWIETERDEALLGPLGAGGGHSDSNRTVRHDEAAFLSFGAGPRVCPGKVRRFV